MLLGAVLGLLLLGGAGPASAHAALTATDPGDGTVLQRAPRHLTLTFSESVGLRDDSFRVLAPDGHRVRTGEADRADGRSDTARVALPDRLGDGTYTVAWRVVSADSHPVSGAFTFSVGAPSAGAAPVTGADDDPLTVSLWTATRFLAYLAAALLVGTGVFLAVCRPPGAGRLRPLAAAGCWTLAAATAVLLLLRAPYEAGTGPAAALDPGALGRTLTTRPGLLLAARLVLLAPAAALLARLLRGAPAGRGERVAGAAVATALALTWSGAEHAAAGPQVPVALVSSVLHLLATASWLGGLAALLVLLRRRRVPAGPELPAAAVARFSRLALTSVIVLVATGVYQSWRGLGSWTALTGTPYGRLLTAKAITVAALVTLAAVSRRWTSRLGASVGGVRVAVPAGEARVAVPAGDVRDAVPADTSRTPTAVHARISVPSGGPPPPDAGTPPLGGPDAGTPPLGGPGAGTPPLGGRAETEAEVEPVAVDGHARVSTDADADADGRVADSDADADARVDDADADEGAADAGVHAGGDEARVSEDPRRRSLRRSVLAEALVAAVVLAVTTVLTGTSPGRADEEAARVAPAGALLPASVTTIPFDVGTPDGEGTVQVTFDPGRTGDNAVQAVVFGADGGLISVPELRLSFTLEARDIGPIDAELVDRGGYWSANTVTLPLPGTWTLRATVRVSEVDQTTAVRRARITP
ncbi:copper resistance CopC/CopD family protein [Streptomyces sp. CRN 30]|uniref:copper resistance CopC/CopD family protein n=1 Tax=Streptomyces sp. CRN 30 TaxID=3075613 RepID=UPI002A82B8C1|nr:copper resistance protein CopC [Streptomyces sp. CRN 30]